MITRTVCTIGFAVALIWGSSAAAGVGYKCPQRIAANDRDFLSIHTKDVLSRIYQDLGCTTDFVVVPLKHALRKFNAGAVDGEALRVPLVETHYTVPFSRSAIPIYTLTLALWSHPDPLVRNTHPIGYVHGILWQTAFVKGKQSVKFHSEDEMLAAYGRGVLGGFLTNDFTVRSKVNAPIPIRTEIVGEQQFYHYTHIEFANFMDTFSRYLEDKKPFSEFHN
ncbi:MAG: hypothetical protein HQ483_10410 [Rhodospirillales bacterium]|nr:hypothetical protein [Rhodospirillales bacterium]